MLVPEISLTPQTIRRFRRRFGRVAVLHSHLSDAERHRHWQSIAAGEVEVVVGVRSAVFAPARRLGLIVIDEEHESTFKQETTPRYHARDVAVKRAQMEGIPILLGSATPSLETWRNADRGRYTRLSMPSRVGGRPMPEVADHRPAAREGPARRPHRVAPPGHGPGPRGRRPGHPAAEPARVPHLRHLPNPKCGQVVKCHACDVAATYHKARHVLICHTCDAERACPPACPSLPRHRAALRRDRHRAAGAGGRAGVPRVRVAADGLRHDAVARQPRAGAGGVQGRRGARSCWARR